MKGNRVDVLGIPFDNISPGEAVAKAMALLNKPGVKRVVTPNPEIVWNCQKNKALREAVAGADLILADGVGILGAAGRLGRPIQQRVKGVEWAEALLPEMEKRGKRLFLLGGKPGVAEKAAANLRNRHPALAVCGTQDGYFSDDAPIREQIRDAGADVVYVCLGSPRQELWCRENGKYMGNILLAALGGTMDVLAGTVKRAPPLWSKLGLEWLYRVLRQPSRLPRLLAIPRFLRAVSQQKRREKKG